jgi:hypothetical protein
VHDKTVEIKGSKKVKAELGQACEEGQDRMRAREPIREERGMSWPG